MRPWFSRGFFAILDQGILAGANFILNILLARWLEPAEYGAFAVAYSVFLLLATFHTAVITEPMLVFGASKYSEKFRKYLGLLLRGHFGLGIVVSLILCAASLFSWRFGSPCLAQALIGLAGASPFILLLWLLRRAFYVRFQPQRAATGSACYFVLVVAGVYVLHSEHWLSPGWAFFVTGVGGLGGGLWLMTLLKPQWRFARSNPSFGMVLADHWSYGSWNVLAQAAYWSSGQILMVLIPIFLGLHAVAVIAAIINLFRPLNLLMQSVTSLVLPAASTIMNTQAKASLLRRQVKKLLLLSGGGVFLYGVVMTTFSTPILHYLYRGQYDGHITLVFLCALIYTLSMVVQVLTVILKATGNIRYVVFVWTISAVLTTLLSIPMMRLGGLVGALAVAVLSYLVAAIVAGGRVRTLQDGLQM